VKFVVVHKNYSEQILCIFILAIWNSSIDTPVIWREYVISIFKDYNEFYELYEFDE
jgi:hypothetical protein